MRIRVNPGWALLLLSVFSGALVAAPKGQTSPQGPPPAAEETGKPSEPTEPAVPRYTSVRGLPMNVTLAQLDNGLTVIVQENHVAPVATVRCYVKNTGSAFEGRYLGAGLSHVLEHVVAGGSTTHRSENEIRKIIETFGGATNAYTTNDMTSFFIDCPAKNTLAAVDLLADWMQHAAFVPAEFARELKVVRRELADDEVDREQVLFEMLDATVYTTHPGPAPGHRVSRSTQPHDQPGDHRLLSRALRAEQSDLRRGGRREDAGGAGRGWPGSGRARRGAARPTWPCPTSPSRSRPARRSARWRARPTTLASPGPRWSSPTADLYALDLAAYILGEGESSRLVRRLKHDRPLVLSVAAASNTPHYVRGYFAVTASRQPETWQQAAEAILREVYRLRDELVDPRRTGQGQEAEGGRAGLPAADRAAGGRQPRP